MFTDRMNDTDSKNVTSRWNNKWGKTEAIEYIHFGHTSAPARLHPALSLVV